MELQAQWDGSLLKVSTKGRLSGILPAVSQRESGRSKSRLCNTNYAAIIKIKEPFAQSLPRQVSCLQGLGEYTWPGIEYGHQPTFKYSFFEVGITL